MYNYKYLFFGLNFLLFLFIILFTQFFSVIISLFLFFVISIIIISSIKDLNQKNDLLLIYNISFFSYVLMSILAYLSFIEIDGFFIYSDQVEFYEIGNELGKLRSIKEIFISCFVDRNHLINEGALFWFGSLAYFANIFDRNSVLFQILNIAYFGILINIFVYKILLFYVKNELAKKYSIYYSLFTYIICFSTWILRDIHIALFFAIAIYIYHLPFKFSRLLILIILQLIIFEFRYVSGIAFLFFPFSFIYNEIKNRKDIVMRLFISFTVLSISIYFFFNNLMAFINDLGDVYGRYSKYSIETAIDQGGLGQKLLLLPFGIKQIVIIIYSQIDPFPPWDLLLKSENFFEIFFGLFYIIAPIYWGFVFYLILINFRKYFNNLEFKMRLLLVFVIIYLIGNSSNLNLRRIISVYPIIYFFFVFIISKMTKSKIKTFFNNYLILYFFLIAFYIILKYLL